MALLGSLFPLICWLGYAALVGRFEQRRPSLSAIMSAQRRRWVINAVARDTPLDAILAGNLMSSISFFASTTVLLVLALFAVYGQLDYLVAALQGLSLGPPPSTTEVEWHISVVLVMFMLAFLAFTLSLRQFNHFCIMLGAADHSTTKDPTEIGVIAALNTLGARNFNHGIRAYYFSIAMLAWFASPWASIAATLAILVVLIHREFFSVARNLVARLHHHEPVEEHRE